MTCSLYCFFLSRQGGLKSLLLSASAAPDPAAASGVVVALTAVAAVSFPGSSGSSGRCSCCWLGGGQLEGRENLNFLKEDKEEEQGLEGMELLKSPLILLLDSSIVKYNRNFF